MSSSIRPQRPLFNAQSAKKTYGAAEIAELLDDLYKVGPQKPMGYLPLSTITQICRKTITGLQQELEERGMKTLIFYPGKDCNVGSGALYAWHEDTLKKKLEGGKDILAPVGLTTDCEDYVRKISRYDYYVHPVYGFIAETFGQPFRMPVPGSEEESTYPGASRPRVPTL